MKDEEIKQCIDFMNALYINKSIAKTRETVAIWKRMLDGYKAEDVIDAITRLSVRSRYRPDLPEILADLKTHSFGIDIFEAEGGLKVVRVIFGEGEEMVPFVFEDRDEANSFLAWLKGKPEREEILDQHMARLAELHPYLEI